MSENFNPSEPKRKRPVFLIVLLILTGLSLLSSFFAGVVPILSGPMSAEQLEQEEVKLAKSKQELEKLFDNEEFRQSLSDGLDVSFAKVSFIHTKAFWIFHLFQLITFSLGAAAIYFMFHLKKLGFHLYIIYSLVSVGQAYLIFPKELITSADVIGGLVVSGLFVMLYAFNLKHFHNGNTNEEDSYTYSN